MKTDLLVVGAGAAGLVAAIAAARGGISVSVLEQKDKPGRKLLATGNGKCNYTNQVQDSGCYRSTSDEASVSKIREQFPYEATISFFKELGIVPYVKNGYVYPYSGQAASVLDALLLELRRLGVPVFTGERAVDIRSQKGGGLEVVTGHRRWCAKKAILACGGKASPSLGSDGSGYAICKKLGHTILPVAPALTGLKAEGMNFRAVAGVRTRAKLDLYIDEKWVCSDCGELQLTAYGISGIPVFQISRFATLALRKKQSVKVCVRYAPDLFSNISELENEVCQRRNEAKNCGELLTGLIHQKLALALISSAGIKKEQPSLHLSQRQLKRLCQLIWNQALAITGDNGMEHAQVCAGGVPLGEICPGTMESSIMPGIYLVGELLDVDGICGGYNLQWAWTTGYLAGAAAAGHAISKRSFTCHD